MLREGQDVVLDLGNGHDSIRLKDWLTSDGYRNGNNDIEQIVFADGTIWTPETLSSMGLTTLGTSGNDTLKGWQGKDILLGGDGDDVLDGGMGSNRLEGGAGNDVLKVAYRSADNVLIGGTGDDTFICSTRETATTRSLSKAVMTHSSLVRGLLLARYGCCAKGKMWCWTWATATTASV
ncbi:hypothetical protein AA93_10240 [Xylella fastidiosa subsp. pauca 11399]|nr:hypothetical protein AA93_10240 [Xylella fastidiosa subsp. pauca 11399]